MISIAHAGHKKSNTSAISYSTKNIHTMMKQTVILLAASLLLTGLLHAQAPKLVIPTGFNNSPVSKMLVSPDGKILYTLTESHEAKCFDAISGMELHTYEGSGTATDMLLSPNGKLFVLLGTTATVYDAATAAILGQAKSIGSMYYGSFYYGSFLDNDNFCASTMNGLFLFNKKNWSTPLNKIALKDYDRVAVSQDGKFLAVQKWHGGDRKLDIWNLSATITWKSVLLGKINPQSSVSLDRGIRNTLIERMEFTPDSKTLRCILSGQNEKGKDVFTAQLIDAKTGKISFEYNAGTNRAMFITDDGKVLLATSSGLDVIQIKDGKKAWQQTSFYKHPQRFDTTKYKAELFNNITAHGNDVYFFTQSREVARAGLQDGQIQKNIGGGKNKRYHGSFMAVSADKHWLAISTSNSQVAIWDLKFGKLISTIGEKDQEDKMVKLSFSQNGEKLMIAKYQRSIEIIETKTGKSLAKIKSGSNGFACDISPDGDYFLYDYNGLSVFRTADGKLVHNQPVKLPTIGKFSADGEYIFYYDSELLRLEMDTWITKKIAGQALIGDIANTKDGNSIAIGGKEAVQLIDKDGKLLKTIKYAPASFSSNPEYRMVKPAFSVSGKKMAAGDVSGGDILVYDVPTSAQQLHLKNAHISSITGIEFLNENIFLSGSGDKRFKLWGIDGKLRGEFFLLENNEWVFTTADGRFDGSAGAIKKLYYAQGFQTIPMDNLYEKFYTPNLLVSILQNGVMPAPDVDITKLAAPPKVKMVFDVARNLVVGDDVAQLNWTNETISVKVTAECTENAIDEIRLYLNGKLINSSNRNLVVEDEKNEKSLTKTFTIQLTPGINSFKAIALNKQRTESKPDETNVNYIPAKNDQVPIAANDITLHLLVIGINNYKNPRYNLNYAKADASSFKEEMEQKTSSIFSKTKVYFITDAEAMKANIEATFNRIVAEAKPQDIFVFYYAGHGVMSENGKKEFYIVPYDVTQLYGAEDALAQKGISAKELQEFSTKIPAQKQLYILDACQSAGALDAVAMRGAAEEKAIAQLARSTGTHWLTASGSEQFATEFSQLGHGVFTYVLLQGLLGGAANGDKQITINELKAYLEIQVPELSQNYKGAPQYPASYGFGNDFPVMIIK